MSTPPHSSTDPETCDSCGAPADDVAPVHRVYVTPSAWDVGNAEEGGEVAAEHVDVMEEVERWCFPCRSQYPHQPIGG